MPAILAANVSARIEALILRRFSLDGFAAMVRGYGVTFDSLIASAEAAEPEERPCQ